MTLIEFKLDLNLSKLEKLFCKLKEEKKTLIALREQRIILQKEIDAGHIESYYEYFIPTSFWNEGYWRRVSLIQELDYSIERKESKIYKLNDKIEKLIDKIEEIKKLGY